MPSGSSGHDDTALFEPGAGQEGDTGCVEIAEGDNCCWLEQTRRSGIWRPKEKASDDPPPPRRPVKLRRAQTLRGRIQRVMNHVAQDNRLTRVNLTDNDARLMKGRQGIIPVYNAQAMAAPVVQSSGNGMLTTGADLGNSAADSGQLVPMLKQAEEMIGNSVPAALADGGYQTAANLAAGEQRGDLFVMPQRYRPGV